MTCAIVTNSVAQIDVKNLIWCMKDGWEQFTGNHESETRRWKPETGHWKSATRSQKLETRKYISPLTFSWQSTRQVRHQGVYVQERISLVRESKCFTLIFELRNIETKRLQEILLSPLLTNRKQSSAVRHEQHRTRRFQCIDLDVHMEYKSHGRTDRLHLSTTQTDRWTDRQTIGFTSNSAFKPSSSIPNFSFSSAELLLRNDIIGESSFSSALPVHLEVIVTVSSPVL